MEETRIEAVLIAGPTASGKSSLALALAQRCGGWILNADSMQVYREIRILSARPDDADMATVPHRLFGHVSVTRSYSVGHWLEEARDCQAEARLRGRVPIYVGGTGLYFRALLGGLVQLPEIPGSVRGFWRARLKQVGAAALHQDLESRDPAGAACLQPTDGQRIVRALEVVEATGKPLSAWQAWSDQPPVVDGDRCLKIVLASERDWLHERINSRFDRMMETGGWQEAERLAAIALDPELPAAKAIGVRELMGTLKGRIDRDQAVADAKTATRRYAKRQETWFRNQMAGWRRVRAPVSAQVCDDLAAEVGISS